jgi:hypothetical protein
LEEQREELARRFFAAAQQGDLACLEVLLADDVELTGDGGGKVPALARSLRGRNRVARALVNWFRLANRLPGISLRPAEINGTPGAVYLHEERRLVAVVALEAAGGEITRIGSVVNPDKLAHLGPVADLKALIEKGHGGRCSGSTPSTACVPHGLRVSPWGQINEVNAVDRPDAGRFAVRSGEKVAEVVAQRPLVVERAGEQLAGGGGDDPVEVFFDPSPRHARGPWTVLFLPECGGVELEEARVVSSEV